MESNAAWQLIDTYFREHAYPFTRHHIESFRQFLKHNVPLTITSYNPIVMVKYAPSEDGKAEGAEDFKVELFIGGIDGKDIRVDRPTTQLADGSPILLTPSDARMRDATYRMNLLADIVVRYTIAGTEAPLKTFKDVVLGQLPIMLHSDACLLHGQSAPVLRALGECEYDQGGYFVIDGKEKVVISNEQMSANRLFVEPTPDDSDISYKARIICTGETGETALSPRIVNFRIIKKMPKPPPSSAPQNRGPRGANADADADAERATAQAAQSTLQKGAPNGAILVSAPGVQGELPLFALFRALGLESDEEIIEAIVGGPITPETPVQFLNFLRPSIAHAAGLGMFTRAAVWKNLEQRVYFKENDYVHHVLANDLFPNMNGDTGNAAEWRSLFPRKAKYLGHLVADLMYVALGINAPSDRDSYAYKRIHVSGMLLSTLFQQAYSRVRDICRRLLDREYHYGSYKNTGNMTDLIRNDNIHYYLPSSIITDTFQRSLKGAWGLKEDQDPEQGMVQDLTRISYIGYLSHVRRVNNDLDPALKITSPHRLHSQQWGIMCPFESPDGAAIGYLKNFAFMTQITFGTNPNPIRECLESLLGVLPLRNVNLLATATTATGTGTSAPRPTRIFVNGQWFGTHADPPTLVQRLRILRGCGLINAFTSISWSIPRNEILVLTEAGRACRPLLRIADGKVLWTPSTPGSWYDWVFGTLLPATEKTSERYYEERFIDPRASKSTESEAAMWKRLESHMGCIEYLDIEEVNTSLIAMRDENATMMHTHAEIHAATLLSVVTQNIPFANHNAAARNIFHAAQTKQAVGIYSTNFNKRFDTAGYIMHYPERAIINTRGAHYTHNAHMPNGFNAIVAVATYTGYNQEDGVIVNRSAIDRGMFQITAYKTMTAREEALSDTAVTRLANISDFSKALEEKNKTLDNMTFADYSILDDEGIARTQSMIPKGRKVAVIGLVKETTTIGEEQRGVSKQLVKRTTYTNVSRYTDVHHYGKVDRVALTHTDPTNPNSYRTAKVRFRKIRRPELGDKFCVTPDHDVLTTKGWVPIAQVTTDHKVCTLVDGAIEYTQPTRLYEFNCEDEDMFCVQTADVDLCTTMNHKMYVRLDESASEGASESANFELIEAHNLIGHCATYKKNAANLYPDINDAQVPSSQNSLPEWVWRLSEKQSKMLYDDLTEESHIAHELHADDIQRLALHAGCAANIIDGRPYTAVNEAHASIGQQQIIKHKYTGPVFCIEVPSHVFYVRRNGKPVWTGNSSRHGQKGVAGIILTQEEMPFTKDGLVPDIIINPHAFPSRMTVGHLVETVFAKLCTLDGVLGDGTVFMPFDMKEVGQRLEKEYGFESTGNEIMYNGRTGEQMDTEVFFGPTFYMRLKHMVADKVHARGTGAMDQLTRQPTSGRSAGGGLRIGEMERDTVLAHGLAQFAKESMMERSDAYSYALCRDCGVIAVQPHRGLTECRACASENVGIVRTPYAFKLLVQEFEAMGIQMRMFTEPQTTADGEESEEDEYDEGDEGDEGNSMGGGSEKNKEPDATPTAADEDATAADEDATPDGEDATPDGEEATPDGEEEVSPKLLDVDTDTPAALDKPAETALDEPAETALDKPAEIEKDNSNDAAATNGGEKVETKVLDIQCTNWDGKT